MNLEIVQNLDRMLQTLSHVVNCLTTSTQLLFDHISTIKMYQILKVGNIFQNFMHRIYPRLAIVRQGL